MNDNTGITFRPPEDLKKKLEKYYEEAMKFDFDEVFERSDDGKMTCKLDPECEKPDEDSDDNQKIHEFMDGLRANCRYWEHQDGTVLECLEGLAFSILVMLDGMSCDFDGNIDDLKRNGIMLHELFYEKKND